MSETKADRFRTACPADCVRSKCRIYQSPVSDDPPVPRGTHGYITDSADGWLWVDFGEIYGVVCCDVAEVKVA
jgi:hypothetical protein